MLASLRVGLMAALLLISSLPALSADKPYHRDDLAEAAVHEMWRNFARVAPRLPWFAGGKSFGGRMTSRAHVAAPLAAESPTADTPSPEGASSRSRAIYASPRARRRSRSVSMR